MGGFRGWGWGCVGAVVSTRLVGWLGILKQKSFDGWDLSSNLCLNFGGNMKTAVPGTG